MLLRSVRLIDVGQYGGGHEFDLVPRRSDRPVILFGGHNGAGKTTFLNSIPLCLYGRAFLGTRVKTEDYQVYLYKLIHRARGKNPELPLDGASGRTASIQVVFEHSVMGDTEVYVVTRSWQATTDLPDAVTETLLITKDEQPLSSVDSEHWEDFLRGLLPIGLTKLFFFDGEKINRLADDDANKELSESVQSLLGVDLVTQLEVDLRVYRSKEMAKSADKGIQTEIDGYDEELREIGAALKARDDWLVAFRTDELDPCEKERSELEDHLAAEGSELMAAHKKREAERQALKEANRQRKSRVLELAREALPFAICRSLSEELRAVLRAGQGGLGGELDQLVAAFVDGTLAGAEQFSAADRKAVGDVFRRGAEEGAGGTTGLSDETRAHLLGDLSSRDREWALEQLVVALSYVPSEAQEISSAFDRDLERQAVIEHQAAIIPEEDADPLKEQRQRLHELHRQTGALREREEAAEREQKKLAKRLEAIEKLKEKAEDQTKQSKEAKERLERVETVGNALAVYKERAVKMKLTELEAELATCFGELCQKDDLVQRVEIDQESFGISLYGKNDKVVPRDELSAGEKQILGISILWALARTSGRPLPVMIDTPLARLDSKHRANLLHRYFPYASHQVVVFSTDTEVDTELYEEVKESVSHVYTLRYDADSGSTVFDTKYFGRK
jgi:DNA sulfur modification protein DndD